LVVVKNFESEPDLAPPFDMSYLRLCSLAFGSAASGRLCRYPDLLKFEVSSGIALRPLFAPGASSACCLLPIACCYCLLPIADAPLLCKSLSLHKRSQEQHSIGNTEALYRGAANTVVSTVYGKNRRANGKPPFILMAANKT
jgi:hypothetical protein